MNEVTITATLRPNILRQTLTSFMPLFGDTRDWTAYVNVDLAPLVKDTDIGWTAADVLRVAAGFFGHIVHRIGVFPNFARAVRWCWQQPIGQFFFHLEDDWELAIPDFPLSEPLFWLQNNPQLTSVTLRAHSWDQEDTRICLSPGVFRTAHAREIAGRMVDVANPEKQLRTLSPTNPHGGKHGSYVGRTIPRDSTVRVVRDIGRDWLRRNGLVRDNGEQFTAWIRHGRSI